MSISRALLRHKALLAASSVVLTMTACVGGDEAKTVGVGRELVEDAVTIQPHLLSMFAALKQTGVADHASQLTATLTAAVDDLSEALRIIETNATDTISTRCDVIVKAAVQAGWVVSPELTDEKVDNMKPWLVQWIAGEIIKLYNEATSIPKN